MLIAMSRTTESWQDGFIIARKPKVDKAISKLRTNQQNI
jgi:hypothetical protein